MGLSTENPKRGPYARVPRPPPRVDLTPGIQADGESTFDYIERLGREHDRVAYILRAIRAGKLVRPNIGVHAGQWGTEISKAAERAFRDGNGKVIFTLHPHKREPRTIYFGDPVTLILEASSEVCFVCGCDSARHETREPSEEEKKRKHETKMRCGGERVCGADLAPCACARTRAEIRDAQRNRKWIAERLRDFGSGNPNLPSFRGVDESNVFEGLRGPSSSGAESGTC